jgi:ADP-ribose pyrophosphatase YjhB (NUDIX family)
MKFRFCPVCGAGLQPRSQPDGQVVPVCRACGHVFYRNSKPTAGALIVRGGRLLLARRAIAPAMGRWDIPGGFLHHGEHPREGVIREIREETGLEIEPGELLGMYIDTYGDGDQADPDFILNIYFHADCPAGEPVATDDVAELAWFAPHELPGDYAFAHTARVLADWRLSLTAAAPRRNRTV